MIENKSKEGMQQKEVVELLNQSDPFYGIYMVYDMYGPSSNEESQKNQTETKMNEKN